MSAIKNISTALSSTNTKLIFNLKKHSPTIAIVLGVAGIAASFISACSASRKLDETVEHIHEDIYEARTSGEDSDKNVVRAYINGGVELAKLYGPSVALAGLSIYSIIWSHKTMTARNAVLLGAVKEISKKYESYRDTIKNLIGEDSERNANLGLVQYTDEDGTVSMVPANADSAEAPSIYARYFDELNPHWEDFPEYNLTFLLQTQNIMNELLAKNGCVFLNEVYDHLGIPRTKIGQIVGWLKDGDALGGDGFIDFKIYDANDPIKRDFVNGYAPGILLDFNVDGVIYDLI